MARTTITAEGEDLVDDSGTVLWSFIRGEQLEFPIVINFLTDCTDSSGYEFAAIILEAENAPNQVEAPDTVESDGEITDLTEGSGIRLLHNAGTWDAGTGYDAGDLVLYNTKYYSLLGGTARINSTTPNLDLYWAECTKNTIFVRFPDTLGSEWAIKPKIGYSTYGFFELSVQEPSDFAFRRKWKPVRGMVELLYSPIVQPAE